MKRSSFSATALFSIVLFIASAIPAFAQTSTAPTGTARIALVSGIVQGTNGGWQEVRVLERLLPGDGTVGFAVASSERYDFALGGCTGKCEPSVSAATTGTLTRAGNSIGATVLIGYIRVSGLFELTSTNLGVGVGAEQSTLNLGVNVGYTDINTPDGSRRLHVTNGENLISNHKYSLGEGYFLVTNVNEPSRDGQPNRVAAAHIYGPRLDVYVGLIEAQIPSANDRCMGDGQNAFGFNSQTGDFDAYLGGIKFTGKATVTASYPGGGFLGPVYSLSDPRFGGYFGIGQGWIDYAGRRFNLRPTPCSGR